jgi:hypothetical protein
MEHWELAAREACRDTLAQYTHAGDRLRLDEFAAAFCDDGVLEIKGSTPVQGRRAIAQRIGGIVTDRASSAATTTQDTAATATKRIVRHSVTNIRFTSVSPTEAMIDSYFTVLTDVGLDHMGRYRDRLVPVGSRWLIAHRLVATDWHAPTSLFT